MTVREKLVELIRKGARGHTLMPTESIANYLVEHGVTVQEWISVEDRLPKRTLPPKDVLVYHDLGCGMFIDRAWYSYDKKKMVFSFGYEVKSHPLDAPA